MDTKWYGWGLTDKTYPLDDRPYAWPFLTQALGLSGDESYPVVELERIELPAPRLSERTLNALRDVIGHDGVSTARRDRVTHALGKSYRDLVRLRRGEVKNPPDAVVYPSDEKQVSAVLQLAAAEGLAVVPFGGGTSVVGGVEPRGERPAITLDLRRMNRVLAINTTSHTATIQAGILGPDLEAALNSGGFTLGHFPQSFEFSCLGGWIATRSAGQQSTGYGKIEDLVVSLRVVTPVGIIETRPVPASASGPSLKELLVGSEGVLGVITQATMRIRPLPPLRDYRGLLFRSFSEGVAAVRKALQAGLRPATIRLSDEEETRASLALRHPPKPGWPTLKERLGQWVLSWQGYSLPDGCLMILGCEGEEQVVRREIEEVLGICRRHGGFHLGRGVGRQWYAERFELPYLRDVLLDQGVMVDTLETATTWDNLGRLYQAVKQAVIETIESGGVRAYVMCHLSHAYPTGASLYSTFLARQLPGMEIEQWQAIKRAATDSIMAHGGILSHHHGVGYEHAPWMEQEHGPEGMVALRALKAALDPEAIMNPGKLLKLRCEP